MPSSVIFKISYDTKNAILRITFVSGTIYEYMGVPEDVYKEMTGSFSKGKYFNENIKGCYDFQHIR